MNAEIAVAAIDAGEGGASTARAERIRNWLAIVALIASGIVWPGDAAHPAELADVRAGTLLLRTAVDAEPVEALRVGTRIEAAVTANVARVRVQQEFRNESDEWVDGLYVFPLAADAAVDELEMVIGERRIRGEIRRKAEARATFERARSEGRRASLVEQERPNLFTSAVANLAPRSSITIEIAYLETLPPRDGEYSLRLPLAITPRYTPGVAIDARGPMPAAVARAANTILGSTATPERVTPQQQRVHIAIELAPGFQLHGVRSLHHPIRIEHAPHGRSISLVGDEVAADRDFELVWSPQLQPETQIAAFAERSGENTYALVLLTPPESERPVSVPPREVIFIMDTSGSMHGPSIEQARTALLLGIDRLTTRDRFNVVRFASDASALFGQSEPVDDVTRRLGRRYVAAFTADGGTEMRGALELAFSSPAPAGYVRQMVFITDGAVSNEAELVRLIAERAGDARLFTVGIGAAPNGWFVREAAAAGRGASLFIGDVHDVQEQMQRLFRRLEHPALLDLELAWPGGAQPELASRLPRDLYAGDPLVVLARLPRAAGGTLTLSGSTHEGAWVRQLPLAFVEGQPGIAKLWARERIAALGRQANLDGERQVAEEAIVRLALAHHLVSDFTSLVAVDVTPVRPPELAAREAQAPTSAPAGGAWATTGFATTATPASLLALMSVASFLAAALLAGAWRWRAFRAL